MEAGATAADGCRGDITASIAATGQADASVTGTYTVRYNVDDGNGNSAEEVTRTVQVVDTTAPVVTLAGAAAMTVEFGGSYTEPGATATDACAANVAVTVGGAVVNTSLLGAYTVRYGANDGNGNTGNAMRVVTVADTTAPTGGIVINNNRSATNTPNVTLALTWNDGTGSGVTRMRFSDDGSHWTAWLALATPLAYTLPSGDAHKTVRVQYLDRGNNRSATFSDYILLDTSPPTGSIVINGGALSTSSRTVTLGLTWADAAGAGVTRMRFSDDGAHWSNWMFPQSTFTHTLSGATGYNTVRVQFLDGANNYSVVYNDYIKLLAP